MLDVSEQFRELMKSNIRPKCEPTITVKNGLGTGRDLIWKAKNISKMTFKRGIDPIGRTLPFMELRWTEIYNGKLNENAFPQIYENVAAFLPVELKFEQSLGFFNTWKNLLKSGKTWKEIFDSKTTWKQLKTEALKEEFVFPTMFLSAKPTIKNNSIEWVAYDLMRFLDSNQSLYFQQTSHINKVKSYVLRNCCSAFLKQKEIIDSISKTIEQIDNDSEELNQMPVFFDGSSNSFLKDYSSVYSLYWDFEKDYMKEKKIFDFAETGFEFPLRLQYKNPIVSKNEDISVYQYKRYYLQENPDGLYEKEWDSYQIVASKEDETKDFYVFKYIFQGFGKVNEEVGDFPKNGDMKIAFGFKELPIGTVPTKEEYKIVVIPLDTISLDELIVNNNNGTAFVEDNKLSRYPSDSMKSIERNVFLNRYFSKKNDSLEISCAPNVSIETGDIVKIETNLEDAFGENKIKDAVVVEIQLEYSGKLSQKIKAHEVRM